MPSLALDIMEPGVGLIVDGLAASDAFAASASDIGDFNGDGFDDIAVGSPGAGNDAGIVYILFGRDSATPISFDLAALDATEGVKIAGAAPGDQVSHAVAAAGDLNSDGFEDLVIGAPTADGGAGRAYVVFGSAAPAGDVALASLDGTDGFEIKGDAESTNFGYSVTSAGDFDGDGLADLAIGASGTSRGVFGREDGVFLLFGGSFSSAPLLDLAQLDATQGVKFTGNEGFARDGIGFALDGGVDIDGDGFDDLLIGQRGEEIFDNFSYSSYNYGYSYIVYGTGDLGNKEIALHGNSQVRNERFGINQGTKGGFGHAVEFLGDINGDGFEEFALGAPTYSEVRAEDTGTGISIAANYTSECISCSITGQNVVKARSNQSLYGCVEIASGFAGIPVR